MLTRNIHTEQKVWTLEESFRHCERIAAEHYENFPVASRFIPPHQRKHVAAIYSFARIADDFADEPGMTAAERLELLSQWEKQLLECVGGSAHDPVFVALSATIGEFQIPVDLFQSLLQAFRSDVVQNRYGTFADVLTYCSHSANPIGRLVLLLFNERSESLFSFSDRICTALQLANFWQDISIDLEKDRVYIPMEDLQRFGYSEAKLFQRTCTPEFRQLLGFEIDRTEQLFREGEPLLRDVGKELSFELRLTWNGGMRILKKIRSQDYDVFRSRPTLSGFDKAALFLRSVLRS